MLHTHTASINGQHGLLHDLHSAARPAGLGSVPGIGSGVLIAALGAHTHSGGGGSVGSGDGGFERQQLRDEVSRLKAEVRSAGDRSVGEFFRGTEGGLAGVCMSPTYRFNVD